MKHYELVRERCVESVYRTYAQAENAHPIYRACLAFSNYKLAQETDREELIDRAVNRSLVETLDQDGACTLGLETVGIYAKDWFDLGYRIAQTAEAEWMYWLDESSYVEEHEKQSARDGWFEYTDKDYRDVDED